ncbi:MAG: hypothetical protein M1290_07670 [Candidatus Thermoplasmatota archaeon]|jgi:hypothetical protein|nr:hypothetical protein [Candidatus Thermoplasmatota archaeon]MCL5790320.1 hypothetical protein [Candidatus Thermoplasmatota archaeon]
MVFQKTLRYQNKNADLNYVTQQIVQQLQNEKYTVQSKQLPDGSVIQARKAGILRDIITADRAFTIKIEGNPNDFKVTIGIGKFIQNLAVMAVEALLLSELFLVVDIPEMLWTEHVEKGIIKNINTIIG